MKQKYVNNNLELYYDIHADILEIQIGRPTSCYFDEIEDDLFEGHDEQTGELKGYKIFNFKKRANLGDKRKIKIPLPAKINIISA